MHATGVVADTAPAADDIVEPAALARYDLDLQVAGALKPGAPIHLSTRAHANLPTADAELSVVVPDLDAPVPPVGTSRGTSGVTRVTPRAQTRRAVAAGGDLTAEATVTFPKPGYYRVSAGVRTKSSEPGITEDGRYVQGDAQHVAWLLIDENGGRITDHFDPTLLPDSVEHVPGARRTRREAADRAANGRSSRGGATAQTAAVADGYRTIQLLWTNQDAGYGVQPVDGAYYTVTLETDFTSPVVVASGFTDADGSFQVLCSNGGPAHVRVSMSNGDVGGDDGGVFSVMYDDVNCPGGVSETYMATSDAAVRVFKGMIQAVAGSRAQFGISRGWIYVHPDPNAAISAYSSSKDQIAIASAGPNAAVWGEYGWFTQAHEYGHAFHEKALGGIWKAQYCPSSGHAFGTSTNTGCAFVEGFADYHAAVAIGSLAGYYFHRVADAPAWSSSGNRAADEGPVSAFLYDLSDGADDAYETYDAAAYPAYYVANTIKTCRLAYYYRGFGQVYNLQIGNSEALTWCFERGVNSNLQSQYFPSSTVYQPLAVQANAPAPAGWSQSVVRQLWRYDLFLQ